MFIQKSIGVDLQRYFYTALSKMTCVPIFEFELTDRRRLLLHSVIDKE